MKWSPTMQTKAEVMAACGTGVRKIGLLLGVSERTVSNHLIPLLAEANRRRAKEWHWANREKAVAYSKAFHAANIEKAIWRGIIRRCHNPSDPGYQHYGGRGIAVCDRWQQSFEAFLNDVSFRPSQGHSIDRINNDGHYEPGNVRWATRQEQALNTRRNVWVELDGEIIRLAEGAKRMGEKYGAVRARVERGTHPRLRKVGKTEVIA
jgi:hypothetical protein